MAENQQFIVESIIDKRIRRNKVEYLLCWQGFGDEENTWEPAANLDCPDLIELFEQNYEPKSGRKSRSRKNTDRSILLEKNKSLVQNCDSTTPSLHCDDILIKGKIAPSVTKSTNSEDSFEVNLSNASLQGEDFRLANKENEEVAYLPEEILGASKQNGQMLFLFKWLNTDDVDFVPAKIANVKYPQHVINFYEKRLNWISKK